MRFVAVWRDLMFTVKAKMLVDLLTAFGKLQGESNAFPQLRAVRVTADAARQTVTFERTDLSTWLSEEFHAPVDEDCVFAVNQTQLKKAIGAAKGDVQFKLVGKKVQFEVDRMKVEIPVEENFPAEKNYEFKPVFTTTKEELQEILASVGYARSHDDTRPHMTTICFKEVEGKVRAITTDGHRAALWTAIDRRVLSDKLNDLFSTFNYDALVRWVNHLTAKESVQYEHDVRKDQFQARLVGSGRSLRAPLVDLAFPNAEEVFTVPELTVSVKKAEDLLAQVKRFTEVGLTLQFRGKELVFVQEHESVKSSLVAEGAKVELVVKCVKDRVIHRTGQPPEYVPRDPKAPGDRLVGINRRYLALRFRAWVWRE
jgi:DNA polymerase III sliding clamp (beta) subunit (PCNA family)